MSMVANDNTIATIAQDMAELSDGVSKLLGGLALAFARAAHMLPAVSRVVMAIIPHSCPNLSNSDVLEYISAMLLALVAVDVIRSVSRGMYFLSSVAGLMVSPEAVVALMVARAMPLAMWRLLFWSGVAALLYCRLA